MSTPERLPVNDLVIGLYVSELDRPWLESPFLFQGFPIRSDEELQQLRGCCDYVYVDPQRSESQAWGQLRATHARARDAGTAETVGDDSVGVELRRHELAGLFGEDEQPDPQRFRAELRPAALVRRQTRAAVDELLGQLRSGQSVDSRQARAVVRHLVHVLTRNATASLWLNSLKRRDEYTAIHCINVCVLSLAFGRYLGMEREELEILGLGALMHDIGKMRTPDEVLNKPGPLSREEFAIIQRHPEEGYRAMLATGDVPRPALDIIRLHHERHSGRGYPFGLAGDDIPLSVRIVAIADVYDAMTSDRVYRDAMPADRAIRIMYEAAADDFGRELVEAFIRCVGIYPVGSVVELDSGALGVVVSSLPHARLKPVVLMVRSPDGTPYTKRLLLNLAYQDRGAGPPAVVRRVVSPGEHDIDVAALTREELALADCGVPL